MLNELKSCPHCGGEATIKYIHNPYYHGYVGCKACHCYMQWQHDPKSVIERWNRRVSDVDGYLKRWKAEKRL